jgi:hypothetical protein
MQEIALVDFVGAWLACWFVDLAVTVVTRPIFFDTLAKLIIVLICLVIILFKLTRGRWLL